MQDELNYATRIDHLEGKEKTRKCSGKMADKNELKMCLKMSYLFKKDLYYFVRKVIKKVTKNRKNE